MGSDRDKPKWMMPAASCYGAPGASIAPGLISGPSMKRLFSRFEKMPPPPLPASRDWLGADCVSGEG